MNPFSKPTNIFFENPLQYLAKYSLLLTGLFASTLLMQAEEATEPPDTIKSYKVKQAYKTYQDEIKKANEIIEKATQKYKEELEKEQVAVMKQGKLEEYEAIKTYAEKVYPADDKKEVADKPKEPKPGEVLEDIHDGSAGLRNSNTDYLLKLKGAYRTKVMLVIDATPHSGSKTKGEIYLNNEKISTYDLDSTKPDITNLSSNEIDITKYATKDLKEFKVSFKYSGGGATLYIKSVTAKFIKQ